MSFFSSFFGKRQPTEPPEFRQLLDTSIEELQLKTMAHDGTWHLGAADWSVEQDTGTIIFTAPTGIIATGSVQIIGTYNTRDTTWLWGWEHPSVAPPLQAHAKQLYSYGKQHHIARLTTQKLRCTAAEAWEMTALACKLCDAQGGYRGPSGTVMVFMTFDNMRLSASRS